MRWQAIVFPFDERKTTEAAAYIVRQDGADRMNYMRLIKLLYFADRESLHRWNRPITGDRFSAMKRGPVLSHVLDLIKEPEAHLEGPWNSHFVKEQWDVVLHADPGFGSLSPAEMDLLDEIRNRHRGQNQWDLSDLSHQFTEFKKAKPPEDSSRPIAVEDVLRALKKSDAEIEEARRLAAEQTHFGNLFRDPRP